jgi:hypothetical protein
VAARFRAEYGRDAVGPLYEAIGAQVFDTPDDSQDPGSRGFLESILAQIGLPSAPIEALDDTSLDPELRRETNEALGLTVKDVGTPIIQFQPPRAAQWTSSQTAAAGHHRRTFERQARSVVG